ncbi:MAG TPA: mechanosensitive ion channel domain-containing protein [Geomonas sp.]|nr:mechanosensitive ion channel domain-containing protein [Geomonas sp.]
MKPAIFPYQHSPLYPAPLRHGALTLPLLLFFLCILAVSSPARAANPWPSPLAQKDEPQPAIPAVALNTDEEIDQSSAKLEARLADLRLHLLPEAVAELKRSYHDAATPAELLEWERLANRLAAIVEGHLNTLTRLKSIRKASREREEEMKGWKGFAEKPPYTISLLDGLSDSLQAKELNLQSLEVLRSTVQDEAQGFASGLKLSRKEVRLAEESVEKERGRRGEARSAWLLVLAQLRNSLNEAGALYDEARRQLIDDSREGVKAEIDFLRQKLAAARASYRFTREELERKLREIEGRREQLRREQELALREEELARKRLDAGEAAVRAAQEGAASRTASAEELERLLKERERLLAIFDATGSRVLVLTGLSGILKREEGVWQDRYRLASAEMTEAERSAIRSREAVAVAARWKEYANSQLARLEVLVKSQQDKLSSPSLSEAERDDLRRVLAVYQAQESLLRRGAAILVEYQQLVQRRDEEAKSKVERVTVAGGARAALATVSSLFGKVWNGELYVAEETLIAEGKKIVRPRSVTVGKLAEALLILLLGSWVIRRLKKPIHWVARKRLKLGANDAQLYSRLLSYLLFMVVVIGALVFVNIPLAFFAFLGGALAIGVGFGAQNLIGNFISGLILMFDRTIRMGDIVEVEGHRGRVASIGMRSSSIKRFDGVEMLVPNSLFLQQNVINWTSSDKRVRYSITVGVAYGSPTKKSGELILQAVQAQHEVLPDPPPYVVFENFGESSLTFIAYFWVELDPAVNTPAVFSDIRHRIGELLAGAGIEIPFPQRDLHLHAERPIEVKVVEGEQGGRRR